LRARLTKYHGVLGGAVLAAALIVAFAAGTLRLQLLVSLGLLVGTVMWLGVTTPQWQFFGPSVCRTRTRRKVVALTFDDGPDPQTTPALLALLGARRMRATFFCVGLRAAQHPDLTRRIAAEGHAVENHSFYHSPLTNLFSLRRLCDDLARAQSELQRLTRRAPQYFRPPVGLTNPRVFRATRRLGLRVAGFTARGLDRRPDAPEQIVARLLRKLQPGAVFLLHDGGVPRERLLAVTGLLLDKLEAEGYQCIRLDELVNGEMK